VTKRPYFDHDHTVANTDLRRNDTARWQLDTSGPLTDKLAYRVSYEGVYSQSYYRYGFQHSNTCTPRPLPAQFPSDDRFNTEYYIGHYTENTA